MKPCPPCNQGRLCPARLPKQQQTVSVVFPHKPTWLGLLGAIVIVFATEAWERGKQWMSR